MTVLKSLRRIADRWIGIPVLWTGCLLHHQRNRPAGVKTIGLIKGAGMGDFALAADLIASLRKEWPGAQVVLFCGPSIYGLAQMAEGIDRVVLWSCVDLRKAIKQLRAHELDILVDLGQWSRFEALSAACSGAKFRVGFSTRGQARHYWHDDVALHSSTRHERDNFRSLFELVGVHGHRLPKFPLKTSGILMASGAKFEEPYVAFHMWAAHPEREWPDIRWRTLLRYMNDRGYRVLLTGSLQDKARVVEFISKSAGSKVMVSDATCSNLSETIGILQNAKIVVSINTGIMHLAATLGCRVVGLSGPTSAQRWGPLGASVRSVQSRAAGSGYLNLGIEQTRRTMRMKLMEGIPAEEVCRVCAEWL